jgi:hypothetical protein
VIIGRSGLMKIKIGDTEYIVEKLPNGKWTLPDAYERGDTTCCCGALDIDGNRVETSDDLSGGTCGGMFRQENEDGTLKKAIGSGNLGRYPAQTFIDSNTAQVLDMQSGKISGSSGGYNFDTSNNDNPSHFITNIKSGVHFGDIGGCSKILHKCDFEKDEHDLYFYNPKVSKSERNAGCDDMEDKIKHWHDMENAGKDINNPKNYLGGKITHQIVKNNHPTLKPIKLNKNILSLFKTPNEQSIIYPFAGSGSEVIGGIKAGFTSYIGCEISQDYIDIALARIEYWSNFEGCELPETTEVAEGQISIWDEIC